MKYFFLIVMLLFAIGCGSDSNSKPKSISNLSTFKDSTSYALGADLGSNLKQQAVEIDYDVFMAGLTDAMMDGDLVKLDQKQRREVMASLQKSIRDQAKKEVEVNLKKADEFLDKNKADNPDVKETPTGLQYRVLREGDGDSPVAADKVKVHYAGRLMDGTEFDSSYKQGKSMLLRVEAVIPGWQEGLQLIGEGGMIELEIPYQLGYGSKGNPPVIPPRATLHFLIEIKKVR